MLLLLLLLLLLQVLLLRSPVLLLLLLQMLLLLRAALLTQTAEHVSALSAAQSRCKMGDLTLAIRTPSAMHASLHICEAYCGHLDTAWRHKKKRDVGALEPGGL